MKSAVDDMNWRWFQGGEIWLSRLKFSLAGEGKELLQMASKEVSVLSIRTFSSSSSPLKIPSIQVSLFYSPLSIQSPPWFCVPSTDVVFAPLDRPSEAKLFASQMIGQRLVTKQTGAAGKPCNAVYICDKLYIRREYYLAILMDRVTQGPVIVASSQGGVDIETVAAENPSAIITLPVNIADGLAREDALELARKMAVGPQCLEEAADTILKLYQIFVERDATQIEINPLAESSDHHVVAMDAKFGFDDNAEFRQPEVFSWRDQSQENADEVKAAEFGLNFIKLNVLALLPSPCRLVFVVWFVVLVVFNGFWRQGSIGCLVNGAGLAMATMDIIKLNGGEPANFLGTPHTFLPPPS
jgi:succinyl-CoA synthetase beta subunit